MTTSKGGTGLGPFYRGRAEFYLSPDSAGGPASIVNWCQAEAGCHWAKHRLPPEAKEAATVSASQCTPISTVHPMRPEAADCLSSASVFGCRRMIGHGRKSTASDFVPFPDRELFAPVVWDACNVSWGRAWASHARTTWAAYRSFFALPCIDVSRDAHNLRPREERQVCRPTSSVERPTGPAFFVGWLRLAVKIRYCLWPGVREAGAKLVIIACPPGPAFRVKRH